MASKIDDVITPKEVGQSLASTLIDDATRGCTSDQMTFQLASLHEAAITILGTQLFNYARIDGWDQDRKAKHIHEIVQGIIDYDVFLQKEDAAGAMTFRNAVSPEEQT